MKATPISINGCLWMMGLATVVLAGMGLIHHPAGTRGYVVSSPDRAIRPQRGMIYTVSFWARAQKVGKALFQWTAYRTILLAACESDVQSLRKATKKGLVNERKSFIHNE